MKTLEDLKAERPSILDYHAEQMVEYAVQAELCINTLLQAVSDRDEKIKQFFAMERYLQGCDLEKERNDFKAAAKEMWEELGAHKELFEHVVKFCDLSGLEDGLLTCAADSKTVDKHRTLVEGE